MLAIAHLTSRLSRVSDQRRTANLRRLQSTDQNKDTGTRLAAVGGLFLAERHADCDRLGKGHRHSRVRRQVGRETARVPARRQAARAHRLVELQPLLKLRLCQLQHGDCARVPDRLEVNRRSTELREQ